MNPTRRDLLRWSTLAALSSAGLGSACRTSRATRTGAGVDFSVAYLTDPHVNALKDAARGTALAVQHAMAQRRAPELILAGGDLAFDILATDVTAADQQYDLFDQAFSGVKIDLHPVLGNHDMLGVSEDSGVSESDPLYGKEYFKKRFQLGETYYSFDHEGWHFVVLDTLAIEGHGYKGWVDEAQLAWLEDDLASSAKPSVVCGHIPLLSNYIEMNRGTAEPIPAGVAVVNAHEVVAVLLRHPVKLVLAGHLHVNESFRYKGIEFANVGAVSGNWWNGARDGFEEGYAVLEFRGGEVTWRYVDYGWQAS